MGDRERVLNQRGRRDAPRMGRALAATMDAQVIYASPAQRAQQTLDGLQDGWPELAALDHYSDEGLYTFSAAELVDWIRTQSDELSSLFMLGHNPGMTELVNWICGEMVCDNLPTAGYACLELDVGLWFAIDRGCGRLHSYLIPRELADD